MRLLPTSDQITDDLNDLKLRIAKMNARRNAQINLLRVSNLSLLKSECAQYPRDMFFSPSII